MNEVDTNAKIIWDYMLMHHELRPMDAIFGLGTHTTLVAERAVDLFLAGYGNYLIFAGESGEKHGKTRHFDKPEAEVYADIALQRGVPKEKIIIENKSTSTGENILFVKKLLEDKNLDIHSFILVQEPYMERRTYATFKKQWPEAECVVTSPKMSYESWATEARSKDRFIDTMVGDLQRIKEYSTQGFQIPQEIPNEVWRAFEYLVAQGFTRRLIKP
ncbi:MAG: YdcF family protein [Patescibacteria group bacterium]